MTRSRVAPLITAALAALTLGGAAVAHHGWSTYTVDNFVLEGKVTELRFGNPHDRLTVVDAKGQAWDVWLGPPTRNARANFNESRIHVGDAVVAYGNRHMDESRHE